MGAVTTTFIAGVEAIKLGMSQPIGSVTQLNTIRLGRRTDNKTPKIKDFVPLAGIEDLEFGGWDIFQENCYEAALHAGVLDKPLVESLRAAHEVSDKANDYATTSTIEVWIDEAERRAWFLFEATR